MSPHPNKFVRDSKNTQMEQTLEKPNQHLYREMFSVIIQLFHYYSMYYRLFISLLVISMNI